MTLKDHCALCHDNRASFGARHDSDSDGKNVVHWLYVIVAYRCRCTWGFRGSGVL